MTTNFHIPIYYIPSFSFLSTYIHKASTVARLDASHPHIPCQPRKTRRFFRHDSRVVQSIKNPHISAGASHNAPPRAPPPSEKPSTTTTYIHKPEHRPALPIRAPSSDGFPHPFLLSSVG